MKISQKRFFVLVVLTAFFPSGTVAFTEEDQQETATSTDTPAEDDRTLLDVFGEVAKEYLTQQVIPETDADCRWNWRHGRCEPYCSCHLRPMWGDYHLGRACRKRLDEEDEHHQPPSHCDEPPNTHYAVILESTLERGRKLTSKTKETLKKWKTRVQEETCSTLPQECPDDDEYRRSWKQRLLCGHIPSPCNDDEERRSTGSMFAPPLVYNTVESSMTTDEEGSERVTTAKDDA